MQLFEEQLARLKKAAKVESDTGLASFLGIRQGAVSNAKASKQIPPAWFFQVADKTGMSLDFLYSGKKVSSDITPKVLIPKISSSLAFQSEDGEEMINIPMVDAKLSAGHGSFQVSEKILQFLGFPSSFLYRKGNPAQMVVMKVEGDSMQPEIMDGDIVLLDQSKTDIRLGRIFAVGFEDAIYLKRIDKLPGKIILKSVNPDYPPVAIELVEQTADQLRVIGQVLWVGREYQ